MFTELSAWGHVHYMWQLTELSCCHPAFTCIILSASQVSQQKTWYIYSVPYEFGSCRNFLLVGFREFNMSGAHLSEGQKAELVAIAEKVVADGKGVLAADEISATIGKRLGEVGVENTAENRAKYRWVIWLLQHWSGLILTFSIIFISCITCLTGACFSALNLETRNFQTSSLASFWMMRLFDKPQSQVKHTWSW